MATYVLIHGGYTGGWCWRDVAAALRAQGHAVFTPTLTGQGERAHLLTRETAMETHVRDVCNVLEFEGLDDVVLVGHSYGTWIMVQAADRMPERVRHLVCLDGQLFKDGESGMTSRTEEAREQVRGLARKYGEGWKLPPPPRHSPLWSDFEDHHWEWVAPRLTPMLLAWFETPCRVARFWELRPPGTMVRFTRSPFRGPGGDFAIARARELGWRVEHLDAGHYAMVTRPREVAATLHEVASQG